MAYSNLYARFYSFSQEVAVAFSTLKRFRASRFYFGAAIIFQVSAWLQAFYIYRHLSGELLVLHYNVNFGIDLVGAPGRIFLYPVYGLAVIVLNSVMVAALYRRHYFKLFAHLLLSAALLFSALACLALMFIYLINFR